MVALEAMRRVGVPISAFSTTLTSANRPSRNSEDCYEERDHEDPSNGLKAGCRTQEKHGGEEGLAHR
jgi:hypothetical protein